MDYQRYASILGKMMSTVSPGTIERMKDIRAAGAMACVWGEFITQPETFNVFLSYIKSEMDVKQLDMDLPTLAEMESVISIVNDTMVETTNDAIEVYEASLN